MLSIIYIYFCFFVYLKISLFCVIIKLRDITFGDQDIENERGHNSFVKSVHICL
jgi:hypothetical protein